MSSSIKIAVSGVYAIVNSANNERYIGSSTNIGMRWNNHKSDLRKGRHSSLKLQADWNEYSEKVFRLEVLKLVVEKDQRLNLEQSLIKDSRPSYNSRYLPIVHHEPEPLPIILGELTLVEVAASLRVGIDAARDLLQSGEIPARKQGRSWRVLESDVEVYKQQQRNKRTRKTEGE